VVISAPAGIRNLGGPHSWSGRSGEEKNLLPLPIFEPHVANRSSTNKITIPMTMCWLRLYSGEAIAIMNQCSRNRHLKFSRRLNV